MTAEQVVFASLTATFALVGIVLTVRNWVYGGSVIRVEMELGRRDDWSALATGAASSWKDGSADRLLQGFRPAQVDLVKVTVRNLGRTAATIHDVGLRAGRGPTPQGNWTAMGRLVEPGTLVEPARIEAHDAKVFFFHLMPIVRGARKAIGEGQISFRASVRTGTGKTKLSRRWLRGKWNVLSISGSGDRSIRDAPLTTLERARLWVELTESVSAPPQVWVRQVTSEAARLADAGEDASEIKTRLSKLVSRFGKPERPREEAFFLDALAEYVVEGRATPEGGDH